MANVLSKPIALSATGTLVAAVANQRIRVTAFALSFSGTCNAKFQSHVAPTDLTGLFYGGANTVVTSPSPAYQDPSGQGGLFETLPGEALDLNLSASVAVGGFVTYILIPT